MSSTSGVYQQQPNCCKELGTTLKEGAACCGRSIKKAGVICWEGVKNIVRIVAQFFKTIFMKIYGACVFGKYRYTTWIKQNPCLAGQIKVGALAAVGAAIVTALVCLCCKKKGPVQEKNVDIYDDIIATTLIEEKKGAATEMRTSVEEIKITEESKETEVGGAETKVDSVAVEEIKTEVMETVVDPLDGKHRRQTAIDLTPIA